MPVLIEKQGPITTIILDRPAVRNAVDATTAADLRLAFDEFDHDPAQLVAVLWGSGGTFCAGYDLVEAAGGSVTYDPSGPGPMGPTRSVLSKPVVAAVEGYAVAGGLELALWCDMRVVADDATFGVFCRRWGVPLVDGGTVRLPRVIGQSRAMDMLLTGRPVGADEALAWGLANRVVPAGTTRAAAELLAAEIASFPQECMRADRASAISQWDLPEPLVGEAYGGQGPLRSAADGAARFVAGEGRSGRF